MLESTFLEINKKTIELYQKVKINVTTKLKESDVNSLAYWVYSSSNIEQNKKQTKINRIWQLKKILFVIGLLKKILVNPDNLYDKIVFEEKLSKVLYKLDEIVMEYDISYDNIIEKSELNTIEYYKFINNQEKSLIGGETANDICNGLINKFQYIEFLEKSEAIKISEILDIYLNLTFISKVFNNYLDIIDVNNNNLIFTKTLQSQEKTNKFILFLTSNVQIVNNFVKSDEFSKLLIIKQQNSQYFDAILN